MPAGGQGTLEGTLDELYLGVGEDRPEQADQVRRRGVARVPIEKADDFPTGRAQRAPHGVALAQRRSELDRHLVLLDDMGSGPGGGARRTVARAGVDHDELVDHPGFPQGPDRLTDDGTDRLRALLG